MSDTNVLTDGLQVRILRKAIYGRYYYYPACEKAELFCRLMYSKHIPEDKLALLQELGYNIQYDEVSEK